MAKEKKEEVIKQANKGHTKATTKQKGEIEVCCNKCRDVFKVKTEHFYMKGSVRHHCGGTVSTVKQRKPKAHKASRDRAIKNKQK